MDGAFGGIWQPLAQAWALPGGAGLDKVTASLTDGVLRVTVPKAGTEKKRAE